MLVPIMKQSSQPNYRELNQALSHTTFKLHPSQVHGLICGILCGAAEAKAGWEALVTGGEESLKAHRLLQNLYDLSSKQLSEFLFDFQLLLPPDSKKLPERAEALTLWCQGMLTGLGVAKIAIVDREPSENTEAINDLIEISKMNYEEVVASKEDEVAYIELVEYVRVAVILIYQTAHEGDLPQPTHGRETNCSNSHLH